MLKEAQAQLAPESTDRSLEVGWRTLGRAPKGGRLLIQALKDTTIRMTGEMHPRGVSKPRLGGGKEG